MAFLRMLEQIRLPGLNELMLLITRFGEETLFLAVVLILFWCVNKKWGYYIMSVGFIGTVANQFLKILCRIPRPWVLDPNFSIVEAAREAAAGYSFPSGHSQSAVGTYGAIAAVTQKKWLRWGCIAMAVLVPFSRMYLGVHTPKDVLVGAGMALVLLLVLRPVARDEEKRWMKVLFPVMLLEGMAYILFVELYHFPADVDRDNLNSAVKTAYTLFGAISGMGIAFVMDEKKLHFPVSAVWWAQILKLVLGLALVLTVKSLLKAPMYRLFNGHYAADAVRYFVVVVVAGAIWPMTFRWFSGLGRKKA